jgi:hypothetical protein
MMHAGVAAGRFVARKGKTTKSKAFISTQEGDK